MADESVVLHQTISGASVAVNNPNIVVGKNKFRPESKTAAYSQCSERARVEPGKRFARAQDIGGRGHEIAAVGHEDGSVIQLRFQQIGRASGRGRGEIS